MVLQPSFSLAFPGVQVIQTELGAVASRSAINRAVMFIVPDSTATTPSVTVVNSLAQANAAWAGSSSNMPPAYQQAAFDVYFRNSTLPLTLVLVENLAMLEAYAAELGESKELQLSLIVSPYVENEEPLSDRITGHGALTELAESTYSIHFVSAFGADSAAIVADAASLTLAAPQGHALVFAGIGLEDSDARVISPATAAMAAALRRITREGSRQPGAGAKAFLRGITAGTRLSNADLTALTAANVNGIQLDNGIWQVFGYRTVSTNPLYRAGTVVQIFNSLGASIEQTSKQFLFESIDGQGELFTNVRRVFSQICYEKWEQGELFGATPTEAFAVVCDLTNNTAISLENLELRADVYAKPSPFAEKVLVTVQRVSLDRDLTEIL